MNTLFEQARAELGLTTKALCSDASKMPGLSYSIPAKDCLRGSKLRKVKGSVCSKCYACKGRYPLPNVQNAMQDRLKLIWHPNFTNIMTEAIRGQDFFRWFDSGDLQSVEHLEKIVTIARNLPSTRFWLPTREFPILAEFKRSGGTIPRNLRVRLSADMIGSPPPKLAKTLGVKSSTVGWQGKTHNCPAPKQGNQCLDCRACWDSKVSNVNYTQH